jgi:ABC-2 type transport system permease protein
MNFSRIKGIYLRYLYVLLKGPQQLSDLFYWPLVDILLWGLASVWIATQHPAENLPLMLMTALILWGVVWRGSVDISVSLLQEFWHRNLVNLFSTPLKLSEWALGTVLLCLCKFVMTVSFGASVVYFLYGLNIFEVGWNFLPFAALLLLFGWTLGFLAGSMIIYWGHQVESLAWMIGYLFAPFSAVFYPVAILPLWAQKVAWALPSTYIFEGMRTILNGGSLPSGYLWISLGLGTLYFALSIALFHFSFQKSRIKGLARLE